MTERREMFVQKAVQLVLPIFTLSQIKSRDSATISNSAQRKEYVDKFLIKHKFIKHLHERYAKQDIVNPYPIRAVDYNRKGSK